MNFLRACLGYTCVTDSLRSFSMQRTEKLAGTVNWGTATVVGIFAGMLYGGSKEAYASVVSMHPYRYILVESKRENVPS